MSERKKSQLGMNPSTASARLVKDILWKFIRQSGEDTCYKCNKPMTRETFSIEHKTPWLNSEDPQGLFFDLDNISFSHLRCNVDSRRSRTSEAQCGTTTKYRYGCRCQSCRDANTTAVGRRRNRY